ncbi:amino acid permease [Kyrpidia spormannii]|uniref:GABA permease n=1 Tax=Kyrpidia spormannii TaxID=2055160 RepID=A0ACA8ZCG2_9BACL|nr:amino acid permease [Kyrpidia spormannii]CAB3394666.1 GABA permease [Kyrpidia spormannii]
MQEGAMEQGSTPGLSRGLLSRHIVMMSLGGVIGAGMFLGSGSTIHLAGPAVVVDYLVGGILLLFVLFALAEMSIHKPVAGSFLVYVRQYVGPMFGYLAGWLYWFCWVLVLAAECTAGATFLHFWLQGVPLWVLSLIISLALTIVNLFQVRAYGEFEFWFAGIKIVTIVLFSLLGFLLLVGAVPGHPAIGFGNLTARGGFFPTGFSGLAGALLVVMFSYGGSEMIGLTAAETRDPGRTIPRAMVGVVWRTVLFYVLPLVVIVALVPWTTVGTGESPFVMVFRQVGVPFVDHVMNFVVLTAVLSSMNSGMYAVSRMLYSLGQQGYAPGWLMKLSGRRVPIRALLASTIFLWIGVGIAYEWPDQVFNYLMSIPGFSFLFVWLLILVAHVGFHRRVPKAELEKLPFHAWGYPVSTGLGILMLAVIIGLIMMSAEQRLGIWTSLGAMAVMLVGYGFVRRESRREVRP